MDDLTAFLKARLDEREHFAKIARLAQKHREQMLREVEAGRAIIKLREQAFDPRFDDDPWNSGYETAMWDVLRQWGTVYSDHPDYRPEWKP